MKREKGITLVALVITIIVLLILAAIAISALAGKDGILTKARESNIINDQSEVKTAVALQAYQTEIDQVEDQKLRIIAELRRKGILQEDNSIHIKNLLGKTLKTGNGSETSDVYKIEETELVYYYEDSRRKVLGDIIEPEYEETAESEFEFDEATGTIICLIGDYYETFGNLRTCKFEEIVIPKRINGKEVKVIGKWAFAQYTNLKKVVLPNTVQVIEDEAFSSCQNLIDIKLPNSIRKIGKNIFSNTAWYISQPNGEIYINNILYTYKGTMPENTSMEIKPGTTTIGKNAFYKCSGLTNITIPSSVITIGEYAFHDTAWYNNQPDGELYINNILYTYKGTISENTSIEIKAGTTIIGDKAFYDCSGLTNITIPNSVTTIGNYAFYDCSGLTNITIPNSVTIIGDSGFFGCSGLTNITIPNNVTIIGDSAFSRCSGLTNIIIPNSVITIRNGAFSECSGLTNIAIPSSVTTIGHNAFYNTAWYNNQENGELYINTILYKYKGTMPANTSMEIKPGTTIIGDEAFSGCSGLTNITIPSSVIRIGDSAFSGCSSLTNITIPSNVTRIGDKAFSECSGLTNITIPNSVTTIGNDTFSKCSGLTNITIPNSVVIIGNNAFFGCTRLTNIAIPSSVIRIGYGAFSICGLTNITIPNSVITIEFNAFYCCNSLTNITIPNSVTTIENNAFFGCTRLTNITFSAGPNAIPKGQPWGAPSSCTITKEQ